MKLVKPDAARTRTVFPFPDGDPDFSVELRKLSSAELNRIYDAHGYNPAGKQTMARLEKVLRDVVKATVVRVTGATDGAGGVREPEADETKLLLLEVPVEIDGDTKSLWDVVTGIAAETERAELKNLLRP